MDTSSIKILPVDGCHNAVLWDRYDSDAETIQHDIADRGGLYCSRVSCLRYHPVAPGASPTHDPRIGSPQNVLKTLPTDAGERKAAPIVSGVLDYFPLAIAEVARLSMKGNAQHNPGQPLHWSRGKSADHADCIARHLIQRGILDSDGISHTAKVAWRALALLQEELEARAGFTPEANG